MKQVTVRCPQYIDMAWQKFIEIARRDGFGRAFASAVAYVGCALRPGELLDDDFDKAWKVNTRGCTSLFNTIIDSPNAKFGASYRPSDPAWIEQALASLSEDFSTFIFIDLGCGKGRALLVASHYGFRKVIGVEFAQEFVEEARRNLRVFGIGDIEVVCEDAANFRIPDGDILVYLFNPFSPEVLRPVLDKLAMRKGLQRTHLIYANPLHASLVDSTAGFRPIAALPGTVPVRIWTCP